jgi:signal transduction histidine kinase
LVKPRKATEDLSEDRPLVGEIANDLNNVLSPVLGYADMIMNSNDPEDKIYQRSEKILKAAYWAAELVSQVLSFNRRGEEERRIIKVHPVLKGAIKLLRRSIPSTIKIIDNISRDCSSVKADPTQIYQVIMSLCTNAFHAMEDTGGELNISLNEIIMEETEIVNHPNLHREDRRCLCLQVSDTGCGMGSDVVERIFDPYFMTKKEGKGTGFGLATVYSIIKSSNGDIRVKSNPGQGTEFNIFLPAAVIENKTEKIHTKISKSGVGSGEKLLIVDDDKDIVEM